MRIVSAFVTVLELKTNCHSAKNRIWAIVFVPHEHGDPLHFQNVVILRNLAHIFQM